MIMRSVSEPSLGTIGTGTIATNATGRNSRIHLNKKMPLEQQRGNFLWEGRLRMVTLHIVMAPWNMWWQTFVILTITYKFIVHCLLHYYLDLSWEFLDITIAFGELIFLLDVLVHYLHAFWPLVRIHIRVYRRSIAILFYDTLTLISVLVLFKSEDGAFRNMLLLSRWLGISRIYRLIPFFKALNESVRGYRKILFMFEHMVAVALMLHASTCVWYGMHRPIKDKNQWIRTGNLLHVTTDMKYDSYASCWYYCAGRFFNVIFGDSFPVHSTAKWFTSYLMLFGYVFIRYKFIGTIAWEMVLTDNRRSCFIDRYHHMLSYLKFRRVPSWLVEQAQNYKLQLWRMKDGVLYSDHLEKLPLPLQTELIFDINVGYFHNSLLFRDTKEAFMRQISLLMKHELYLAGQHIWSQGVVKNGMIFIKLGVLEMLSDEDDESPMIAFKKGTVLGELCLFYSIPSKVTVKAATYVELQVLRRTDFMRVISEYPAMLHHIREKIYSRLKNTRCRQEAILKYDKDDSRLLRTRYRPMKVLKDHLAGVQDEDPTFVDDSHMYYRDENNVRQKKFTSEYLELYNISSNVTTIESPRICLTSNFPWILEPNTSFTIMLDCLHFIMVLYVCITSPQFAIENKLSDVDRVLSTVVIAGLLLNIYVQLTTAIIEKNIKKVKVKDIAEDKMATVGFYLDILSVFPMYIFSNTLDPNGESISGQIVTLFPILQVWHIWDYMSRWETNFNSNVKFICLVKYCLLFLIFCYWSGCFLYIFACPRKLCREDSWMTQLIHWETRVFMTNDAKHERPFISSLAFGTSVFTGTGMSDIAPGPNDLLIVVFLFMLGAYLSCLYTAKVCSIYFLSTQRKLDFKESMRELFYFLSVNHVSSKIKSRVKKFFCVQWYYNNAVSTDEIFNDMSVNIQQEVLSIERVETLLHSPIFQDCSRDFLQTVAANTRTIVLPDNEIVQHAGDIGRDMYILQKGHCNLLDHYGKIVSSEGPGSEFGVVEMLYGVPKVHTVLTSTNCILLHLEYSALVQCWGIFPDISHPIIATLEDPELKAEASQYEESKPLIGRMDVKINRITQEIKESFVVLSGREERAQFVRAFERLGVIRYIRYLFLPGCITPHGIFLKFWCTVRLILAVWYILTVPYNIATKHHRHGAYYNWCDVVLYFDVIIMSYVAYYNHKTLLVTHPLLTVSRYLKRAFILDIISIFPIEEMLRIVNENTDLDLYRMNRILLVTRVTGAFSYWESDIMQVNQAVILLKFLPVAFTIVNFITAFVFSNSCVTYMGSHSYYLLVNCTNPVVLSSTLFEEKYAAIKYFDTFYWVFEIFMGCGCTPVAVSNVTDTWLVIVLQIIGFLYFAFMFGHVASTRSATAHALLEHTEKTKDLANFLFQENVDPILTAKTLRYFEYVWKRTNGSNPQKICRCLNSALMEDTLVFMYERALREVPLFGKVDRSFIRVITQHLNEMYFLKGDTVIQCKDVQTNIYIIYRGKVDVLTSYNEMITCMGPGGMFGNFTGQPISCSGVSIYASRSLDLLVIPSQTFFSLIKYYPKIHALLTKAFEISKDYILPISMDTEGDSSSTEDSDLDLLSEESGFDSRSGSSRYELPAGQLSVRSSQSDMSQAKSSTSVMTYHSYMHASNLFRPGTWLFQGFGYLTCVMATINYVLTLYCLVTLNDCFIFFWLEGILDIFFYVKTYFTIHQGYISRHGELIISATKCRKRYFRHKLWIWTDIIANAPLELLGFCFPESVKIMHYLRANKLFRIKYLLEFYHKTSAELTNNLTTLQTAMTAFIVLLLIHTFACTWLLSLIATSPVCMIRTLKTHMIDESSPQYLWDYTTSFYVMVAELTTTGGDEFVIKHILSMAVLTISLVCGKMLASIVVATSIQVANSTKYTLTSYEKTTEELIDMLKNQGLSSYQMKKISKYIKQLWVTERGRQLPQLFSQIPYVRRCDLMSAMFGHHIRNCYLFSDTGEPFLRQLTVVMDYTIFFPGNYIVVEGDSDARMYWVAFGSVSVVSVRADLTETTHEILGPGDVFGILQGLNRGILHCFSYRAETKVAILTLSLDSWSNILPFFPEAKKIISERSEVLFAQI